MAPTRPGAGPVALSARAVGAVRAALEPQPTGPSWRPCPPERRRTPGAMCARKARRTACRAGTVVCAPDKACPGRFVRDGYPDDPTGSKLIPGSGGPVRRKRKGRSGHGQLQPGGHDAPRPMTRQERCWRPTGLAPAGDQRGTAGPPRPGREPGRRPGGMVRARPWHRGRGQGRMADRHGRSEGRRTAEQRAGRRHAAGAASGTRYGRRAAQAARGTGPNDRV